LGGLATLTYKFTDDINAYASYSHGEKSAGLNLSNLPTLSTALLVVAPELIDNYEVGFKSSLFDNRVTFNADVYWANDTNYQTTIANLNVTPIVTYVANIPAVRSRGVESDIVARPIDNLSLHFSTAYTDAIYVKYPNAPAPFEDYYSPSTPTVFNPNAVRDLSGRPLPLVSKWVIAAGGEYDQPLGGIGLGGTSGYLGGDVNYRSGQYSAASDSIYSFVAAHEVTNLRIGIRTDDGHWDLSLWARNAFDTKYYQSVGPAAFNSGAIAALLGDPRTVGVTLHVAY
jgi:iron complex outermembrane receptor protein